MSRRLWLTSALTALVACAASDAIAPLPPDELRAAPLVIPIAGQTLSLEPSLWRDFPPSSPPNGRPLVAVLRVRSTDSTPLNATIHLDPFWIATVSHTS